MTPNDIELLRQNRIDYTPGALHVISCIKNDIMLSIVFGTNRSVSFQIDRQNIGIEVVEYFKKNGWQARLSIQYNKDKCVIINKIVVGLPKDNPINKKEVE